MSEAVVYTDVEIECVECGRGFLWTAGEQKFYAEHKHQTPKRCKKCREARKVKLAQQGQRG
jgi:hypothetical protein